MKHSYVVAGILVSFVACGGGGGGGDGGAGTDGQSDTTGPQVSTTTPADGALDVPILTSVLVSFDELIDTSTLTSDSFTLVDGEGNLVSATVSMGPMDGTLAPDVPLQGETAYTARVTTGVTDLFGNPLAADHVWSFTTRPRTWDSAELIGQGDEGDARGVQIVMNQAGRAMVVWEQTDGFRFDIWANSYVAGTGWGTAELIETDNIGHARSPRIALNAAGNAIAVWHQADVIRDSIWANTYVVGVGWGVPEMIETDDVSVAQHPEVAIDEAGNAIAVWPQSDGSICANRYVVGMGWGAAEIIEPGAFAASVPQVAMTAAGDAIVVWRQSDSVRTSTWSNRYVEGSGWGTAELVENDMTTNTNAPDVAVNAAGHAAAVWYQSENNVVDNIWANHFDVGTGWATPVLIETNNAGNAADPKVAVDPAGNTVVVWPQSDGNRTSVWANNYVVGTGWSTATRLETEQGGYTSWPQVAMDAAGNAIAIWHQYDVYGPNGTPEVWVNRYEPGAGWGTRERVVDDSAGDTFQPQIAMDAAGNAIAVWADWDGSRFSIWTARFH